MTLPRRRQRRDTDVQRFAAALLRFEQIATDARYYGDDVFINRLRRARAALIERFRRAKNAKAVAGRSPTKET